MTVKERTAQVLEENVGRYVSGADIASELGVTRNAVWKAVVTLKKEGYIVSAVTNRGYCLSEYSDILNMASLRKVLEPRYAINLKLCKRVTSTNSVLKVMAGKNAPEGTIIVAAEQVGGRGRYDRAFASPAGGVYFSILLRPDIPAENSLMITTAAAVAAAEVIEEVSGRKTSIKWVNDIFIGDKKVCGILTEASLGLGGGILDYAILGIGVNVNEPEDGFPKEIKDIAGAVITDDMRVSNPRSRIAGGIINRFFEIYLNMNKSMDFVSEYKKRSVVIGKDVYLISPTDTREVHVVDIDDDCRLIVKSPDGDTFKVSSGEVSLKLK